MDTTTRQLMLELREDHVNMSRILNLMQQAVEDTESGGNPEFELIGDIMRYMTIYPDAVHHPKEDIVYAALRQHRPDLAYGLDEIPEDHKQIAELGLRLRDDIEAILAGTAVRREKFVADACAYINRLRNHIRWEEMDLFKQIDQIVDDEGFEFDVDDLAHIKDPLIHLKTESAFTRLLAALEIPGDL